MLNDLCMIPKFSTVNETLIAGSPLILTLTHSSSINAANPRYFNDFYPISSQSQPSSFSFSAFSSSSLSIPVPKLLIDFYSSPGTKSSIPACAIKRASLASMISSREMRSFRVVVSCCWKLVASLLPKTPKVWISSFQ